MNRPVLVPIPQKVEWKDGSFSFKNDVISLYTDLLFGEELTNEKRELQDFTGKDIKTSGADDADILFIKNANFDEEEHEIEVKENQIRITASKPVGVFRGLTTLKQIYKQCNEIMCLNIYDKPDLPNRATMFDFRFRVPKLQELKNLVQMLVDMKYNQYQLYFESFGFYYEQFPHLYDGERVITPEDIKELDQFCRERYMKLVPLQASFGHMHNWLAIDEFKDLGILEEGGGCSLNPLDPRSFELVEKIFDCMLPYFSSDIVNIGFDEVVELGLGKTKDAADKVGKENLFVDFLLKVNDLINKKYNKKVMFWGDMLYEYPDIWDKIPEDCTIMLWGYNAYDRYFDKHSLEIESKKKNFYICPATNNWGSFTGKSENALYNIRRAKLLCEECEHATGILVTDWSNSGHPSCQAISYFGFAAGACFSWNNNRTVPTEYDEIRSEWEMDDIWVSEITAHTIQYECIKYINNVIFKCSNQPLGDILYRMGNYRYLEGENIGGTTRCFELYDSCFGGNAINMPRKHMKVVSPRYYQSVINYMKEIYAELEDAIGEDDETRLSIEEMKNNVEMVILTEEALILQYYYLNDAMNDELVKKAHDLADEIHKMSVKFCELWLVRNYEKGGKVAYDLFNKLADDLRKL